MASSDWSALKSSVDLRTVVASYGIALKRVGRYSMARCPFHPDRTPSLAVFPDHQHWRCFGCDAHGDVYDFIALIDHCTLLEAFRAVHAGWGDGSIPPPPAPSLADVPEPSDEVSPDLLARDSAYQALLEASTLSGQHHQLLVDRGFDESTIALAQYRSLPPPAERGPLIAAMAQAGPLHTIPGAACDTTTGEWALWGPSGLLIPVRNAWGHIRALHVRSDDPAHSGRRYRWVSSPSDSSRWQGGGSSGSPVHWSGYWRVRNGGFLVITEGPLKADYVAMRLGGRAIGIPGVALWRRVLGEILSGRPTNIALAFDQDADPATRKAVAGHTRALAERLIAQGLPVWVAQWPSGPKGIDDAFSGGLTPELVPYVTWSRQPFS